ncbi:unnamed protein product, partial [marine sediment metagenome]
AENRVYSQLGYPEIPFLKLHKKKLSTAVLLYQRDF